MGWRAGQKAAPHGAGWTGRRLACTEAILRYHNQGGKSPLPGSWALPLPSPTPASNTTSRTQNTTPDDVPICEAYLAFLASGDMGEFW